MEKKNFTVFYSWQSYIGGNANLQYIREKIRKVFSGKDIDLVLLEDSRGEVGSPDIPNTILSKISQSDIFICDVTPVSILDLGNGKKRAIPNPNVMFELGFAVRCLSWDRIICICNEQYGNIEDLPFDISKHRMIKYHRIKDTKKSQKSLDLNFTISQIISNYNKIIQKGNEYDYIKHDVEIYKNMMSFASEREFINGINDFRSSGRYYKWYEKCWDYIQYFQDFPENRFINPHLNECFKNLSQALDNLNLLACRICVPYKSESWEYENPDIEYTKEQSYEILMTQEYRKRNIPYPDDDNYENLRKYYDAIDKDELDIVKYSDDVINAYTLFRDAIKQELII